jgi:hypothetical protein
MRERSIVIPVSGLRRIIVILLVLMAVILAVVVVRTPLFSEEISALFAPSAAEVIDHAAYQAVFLTNGSTYFGKLQVQGDQWFVLTDIFYLSASEQSGTQLIKRGAEPLGPKEPMIIPKQQVLFIENLRDDGDIVTAIRKFKSGQLPAATLPPATTTPTVAPGTPRPSATPTPTR